MTTQDAVPENQLGAQLQRLIQAIEAGGRATLLRSNDALLQSIVEAAARIFGAAAASLLLVDEQQQTLVFRVACGTTDHNLVGRSFPLDQGIAGYVAMTGQPIGVSDVQQDARFHRDFAQSTGYVPRSILAMPLLSGERVIGVMEVLDKLNAASFGIQDMELLGMFARQAAIAIDQSQQVERIGDALVLGLKRLAASDATGGSPEMSAVLEAAMEASPAEDVLALADLFNDISSLGEAERKACLEVLNAFAAYARAKGRSLGRFGAVTRPRQNLDRVVWES